MNAPETDSVDRLDTYFERIGARLGNDAQRASFATYALGLLSDAERKSVEPLVARANATPAGMDAAHQRMLHFVAEASWDDHAVRLEAARLALEALLPREGVEAWVVDDTGFLKQGTHSVGVQRQYTGTAGKVTNCQLGVSLVLATRTEHLPVDFELYLPESWANEPKRRAEARIPDEVVFKTKPELALQMIQRAVAADLPRGVVLGDVAYGASAEFRLGLRDLGLDYAVAVNPETKVKLIGADGKARGNKRSLKGIAAMLHKRGAFKRCTWREGTKKELWANFATHKVQVSPSEAVLLLIEWRDRETEPANYFFVSMPPLPSLKQLVRLVMQRWRIERTYEDLKGELGLDHYEGRRWRGWHHHVSVALCCFAFVVAERARRFPPSARRSLADPPHRGETGAPLPGQLHHHPTCSCQNHLKMASKVPELSSTDESLMTQ
jgi:SRSO17 transposase